MNEPAPARAGAPLTDGSAQHPLAGRVALVTGGAQGLGAAIVRTLASAGAHVVAGDIRVQEVQDRAAALAGEGLAVEGVALDVADGESVATAVAGVIERHQRCDILVNNAGVDLTVPFADMPIERWQRILDVNLTGAFLAAKSVWPHMQAAGRGHIINIVSTAAKRAWPNACAYHASKWGLLGFSHALHTEARSAGIKVTALVSGGLRTPFLMDRFPDIDTTTLQDPENVAATLRFILLQPEETVIPEILVLPMRETSWP